MSEFKKATDIGAGGARTLAGRFYTSPEVFTLERERIFASRWVCVGREQEIAEPGSYMTCEVAGESLIVLRDRSGGVRAFFNVCRHRGTRICTEVSGRFSQTIQCPYHAWTYALDGKLVGAPSMEGTPGFDKIDFPLHRAHIANWEGFLFVDLAATPEPFERAFAPILDRFARYRMPTLNAVRRIDYDVAANWKLIFQNYSECYHCPTAHPQ